MLVTLIGILVSITVHIPLVIGFLPGFLYLLIISKRNLVSTNQIISMSLGGMAKTKGVVLILLLVSFLLPSWYLSGTIHQLVSISLSIITPNHFILLSFLVSMGFSMILGTSVGTLSSIGIPIISSALTLHISPEIVAGALISGAFVGDRSSPFSSAHQLLAHTVEIPVKKQIRSIIGTTINAILLGCLFYAIADKTVATQSSTQHFVLKQDEGAFFALLPSALLLIIVICRVKITYAFLLSIISSIILAHMEGVSFKEILLACWFGVEGLGGGLRNMYWLLLFISLAGAFNGIIEELNIIQHYLDKWLNSTRSFTKDTLMTILAAFVISLIAANQTLPIILTGRSFLPHWSNKYSKAELARVLADSSVVFAGMIPWSVLAIMCSTIVGVPLFDYLPYAIFLWILPLLTIIVSIIRQNRMKKPFSQEAV